METVVVIGAGAVGLAIAAQLARGGHAVLVIERHDGPARETSSRNSGVIHAGIYYAPGSLKARCCVEGRGLLYARCARDAIAHRRIGKLIVATDETELPRLEALVRSGLENGAGELRLLDAAEVRRREPNVRALAAVWSPETGIVDAHALAGSYLAEARAHGADVAYRTAVERIEPIGDRWRVWTRRGADEPHAIDAAVVFNAAGLSADAVAACAGLDVDALGWRQRYCRGDYFTIAKRGLTNHLVYPLPHHAGLGIHVTLDLGGRYHAGPDVTYVDAIDYAVDAGKAAIFASALRRYLPDVGASDLAPAYAGVRPKLYGPDEPPRDFVIEERPRGLVHLVGIESPGLTASESLARLAVARCNARLGDA